MAALASGGQLAAENDENRAGKGNMTAKDPQAGCVHSPTLQSPLTQSCPADPSCPAAQAGGRQPIAPVKGGTGRNEPQGVALPAPVQSCMSHMELSLLLCRPWRCRPSSSGWLSATTRTGCGPAPFTAERGAAESMLQAYMLYTEFRKLGHDPQQAQPQPL